MTVLITLTTAGADSGPFDLYSNIDGYTSAFETGVSKSALLAGYSSALVPDYTTVIRVLSTGDCTNYIDIVLFSPTTTSTSTLPVTTTTTTTGGITTTTTTTSAITTTTTTTLPCLQYVLSVADVSGESASVGYLNCVGIEQSQTVYWGSSVAFCATEIISEDLGPYGGLSLIGNC